MEEDEENYDRLDLDEEDDDEDEDEDMDDSDETMSNDDSSDENVDEQPNVAYDILQTSQHSYLGELNHTEGNSLACFFLPGSIKEDVPMFYLKCFVPSPGQEFPLIFKTAATEEFQRLIQNIFIIGHDDEFGITVNVVKILENDYQRMTSVQVYARQRVKILSKQRRMFGFNVTYYCSRVKFLHEINKDPVSLLRLSAQTHDDESLSLLVTIPKIALNCLNHEILSKNIHVNLKKIIRNYDEINFPKSYSDFTYFVLNFLPFQTNVKSFIIKISSTVERLQYLQAILTTNFSINCSNCNHGLYDCDDLIRMNHNSNSCIFVNPHGYVFELFCVGEKPGVVFDGFHKEFSWFKDYAWSFSNCRFCRNHVGWGFRALKPLSPHIFGTVTTKSVNICFDSVPEHNNFFIDTIRKISLEERHDNFCVDEEF